MIFENLLIVLICELYLISLPTCLNNHINLKGFKFLVSSRMVLALLSQEPSISSNLIAMAVGSMSMVITTIQMEVQKILHQMKNLIMVKTTVQTIHTQMRISSKNNLEARKMLTLKKRIL